MDIRDLGNSGNVDRAGARAAKAPAAREYVIPAAPRDEAKISGSSRATVATVPLLSERARTAGGDRSALVAAARQRLQDGALNDPAVFGATAQRLLDAKFTSI
jgi:hypothetical protein